MRFPDINVMVYAHRDESPNHAACLRWLEELTNGTEAFGLPEPTQMGFLRIVTDRRIYDPPTSMREALRFLDEVKSSRSHQSVVPGPRHWQILSELCLTSDARGNLVPDAYLAALAIEADAELVSCDRDFARFPGLRWFDPVV
jgi:toxin-antitoxin system PIN domain toxin